MSAPNWKNRTLFHGDNLDFMREMNSETIDLIATDPPFNKGRDFHATPDSLAKDASFQDRWKWNEDLHPEWLDKLADDYPKVMKNIYGVRDSYGEDMAAFMCFMGVRLIEMHRLLKNSGTIYLQCDQTASHYLKTLMDAIFGRENFVNQVIWERIKGAGKKSQHKSKSFGKSSDTILIFSKSEDFEFHEDEVAKPYEDLESSFPFSDYKGPYKRRSPFRPPGLGPRPNLCYSYNNIEPPHPSGWTVKKEKLEQLDKDGEIDWVNGKPYRKQRPASGIVPNNIWVDIVQPTQSERVGYPTQKPIALYERILKASSSKGDIVFDPFCGCATTLVVAEKLEREWVGIDIWNEAYEVVVKRMIDVGLLSTEVVTKGQQTLALQGELTYSKDQPTRTDNGSEAVAKLSTPKYVFQMEPPGPKMSRAEMLEILVEKYGKKCQGCDREFDDMRYLQLDHNTPRSCGGINHISNRILLCGPCNIAKSNDKTLIGLRDSNKENGFMAKAS